jgi:hypothetical protein
MFLSNLICIGFLGSCYAFTQANFILNQREPVLKSHSLFSHNKEVQPLQKIELSDEKIGEMIEKTFIKGCLQLATGYVDVLKLFIAATTAAYSRRLPIPYLFSVVETCPVNTANRPLSSEEIDLRSSWIKVTYLTLLTLDKMEGTISDDAFDPTSALAIPTEFVDEYLPIVEEQVSQHLGREIESSPKQIDDGDLTAKALMAYNLKIINLTLSNVKEARLANEKLVDEDAVGPPRPNIPGAY